MPSGADQSGPAWQLGGYLAAVAVTSVGAWFLPDKSHYLVPIELLAIGIAFDLGSSFYHLMTIGTGKFMSGFPLLGRTLYGWFLLASRFSLVGSGQTELGRVLFFKLANAALLVGFHALCQLPMLFQKQRSEYK